MEATKKQVDDAISGLLDIIDEQTKALRAAHDTMLMQRHSMTHLRGFKMVCEVLDKYDHKGRKSNVS